MPIVIAAFIFGVLGIVLAWFLILFWLISYLFTRLSGWGRLVSLYGSNLSSDIWAVAHESVKIGNVRYRRIVKAGLQPEGLYLSVGWLMHHKAVCIPWNDFNNFQPATFYWQPCMQMSVGTPAMATIILSNHLYGQMHPFLAKSRMIQPIAG
jgi:hypothetical protein